MVVDIRVASDGSGLAAEVQRQGGSAAKSSAAMGSAAMGSATRDLAENIITSQQTIKV